MNSYTMYMFSREHLMGVFLAILISKILFIVAKPFNKEKYGKFLGYLILISKSIDILIRLFIEKYPAIEALPFHFCNIAIIISGIYLITRIEYLYTIVYCWSYGAFLTLLIPSTFTFSTRTYILFFFLTHVMIILSAVYGYVNYNHRVSFKGYILSLILFALTVINAFIWNNMLGTNFMYVNDYILPFLSFMPFKIYIVLFLTLHILVMTLLYLVFRKKK